MANWAPAGSNPSFAYPFLSNQIRARIGRPRFDKSFRLLYNRENVFCDFRYDAGVSEMGNAIMRLGQKDLPAPGRAR